MTRRADPTPDLPYPLGATRVSGHARSPRVGGRPSGREVLAHLCGYLPLALALAVFCQVCLLGLRPTRTEARRLGAAEAALFARYDYATEQREVLDRLRRAQSDEIYLWRERRALHAQVELPASGK
jgi:hypothetical protein